MNVEKRVVQLNRSLDVTCNDVCGRIISSGRVCFHFGMRMECLFRDLTQLNNGKSFATIYF